MTKIDTTIYEYEMSNVGASYENPRKETWENYKERKGFTTDKQAIDHLNAWGGKYFIGTQTEYDSLSTDFHYFFYKTIDGLAKITGWRWTEILVDGKKPAEPTFKDFVNVDGAIEITKVEYDALVILNKKTIPLKSKSSPKLAAYIIKGGEYITLHLDKVSSGALASFIGKNGKVDLNALKAVISGHQNKIDSMVLLVQLFAKYLEAIETGTEASLKELPFDTPTELNAKVDELWKIEESQERQELATKLHLDPKVFDIADKYTITVAGDEPEILK